MKLKDAIKEYSEYEINKEELENILIKPKKGRWKAEIGKQYYYEDNFNDAISATFNNDSLDNKMYSEHNMWETKEECERAIEIRKAFREAGFDPDWEDAKQEKYFIYCDMVGKHIHVDMAYMVNYALPYYFENEDIIEKLIETYGEEDIKKYILHVYL